MSHAIIIGIDFGTTYSGVSWALTSATNEIYTIKNWPGKGNVTSEKVPTEISYKGDGYNWGFKAHKDANRLAWIKLLLDPSQNSHIEGLKSVSEKYRSRMPHHKKPVDVVADYFTGLYDQVKAEISNTFGADFYDSITKSFVLTVPAIWSDKAKALTQEAAQRAGIVSEDDTILLVPEPEAAALCCLKTIQPNHIKVGDNFVVVDCGGGTVDLISYEITQLEPRMEVVESAVGTGGLCGSVYLNHVFENLVRERIGSETFNKLKLEYRDIMMKYFDENLKRIFSDCDEEDMFLVPAPGLSDDIDAGVEDGVLVITREDMREIFQPVLFEIQTLVEGQILTLQRSKKEVSAILLVGGFGSSEYLREYLKSWITTHGDIKIMQPPDAWSCIVRGAVMRGLEANITTTEMVKKRMARRCYGVAYSTSFIEGYHPEKHKYWNSLMQEFYCRNCVKWFIEKGEIIDDESPIHVEFSSKVSLKLFNSASSKHFRIHQKDLLAYDGDEIPQSSDDEGVYRVCSMAADLNLVPENCWRTRNSGGEDYKEIRFDKIMTLHSALLSFEMKIDGKTCGSVNTKFI